MEEVRRKLRSKRINGFYSTVNPVEGQDGYVTGFIYITTDDNEEITVFQALVPISRADFNTRFAALETALNEVWFEIPADIEYRPAA